MILLDCFFHGPLNIWDLIGLLFAIIAILFYFFRPRLCICICIKDNKINVKVQNKNIFRTITEVQCEICVTKNNFQTVKTITLLKDKTLAIKTGCDEYIFKENDGGLSTEYNKVRVRILVPNLIGIKKLYERVQLLSEIHIQN